MGATIVEREYLAFVTAKQYRMIGPVYYHHLVFFQFSERCGVKVPCKTRRDPRRSHSQEDNRFIVPTRGVDALPPTSSHQHPSQRAELFTNASKQTVRFLCLCVPAGQEEFLAFVETR